MKKITTSVKQSGRYILLFLSIMLIANSCKKDATQSVSTLNQPNTQQLQQWYKANVNIGQLNPFGKMAPNWNTIYVNEQASQLVYEISLTNSEKVFQANGLVNKDQTDQAMAKNNIRLLIFKDKQDGQIKYGSYMSVLSEGTGIDLAQIHYRQADRLNGKILYYDTQGQFANGWVYNSGKISHIVSGINEIEYRAMVAEGTVTSVSISPTGNPKSSNGKVISLKQPVYCTTQAIPVYGLACISAGGSGTITCEQYVIRYDYFTSCTDPGMGGGDGGGGYTPPTQPGGGSSGGGTSSTKLKITFEDRYKYPRLAAIVDGLFDKVKNDKPLLDLLVKYSLMPEAKVLEKLKSGEGPTLVIKNMDPSDLGEYRTEEPNVIYINKVYADKMNEIPYYSDPQLDFLFTAVILHEYIHFGNTEMMQDYKAIRGIDAGEQFENKAFGGHVSYEVDSRKVTITRTL